MAEEKQRITKVTVSYNNAPDVVLPFGDYEGVTAEMDVRESKRAGLTTGSVAVIEKVMILKVQGRYMKTRQMVHDDTPDDDEVKSRLPKSGSDHNLHVGILLKQQKEIGEWQRATFPHQSFSSLCKHLERELKELSACDPSDIAEIKKEAADMVILLFGIANIFDFNLMRAVNEKMEINKTRKWGEPDEDGVVEHIKDDDQLPPITKEQEAAWIAKHGKLHNDRPNNEEVAR